MYIIKKWLPQIMTEMHACGTMKSILLKLLQNVAIYVVDFHLERPLRTYSVILQRLSTTKSVIFIVT